MLKQYVQALGAAAGCRSYTILGGTGGGSWSASQCSTNAPISGNLTSGQSIQTPCIVEGTLVLNNATIVTSNACSSQPIGRALEVGYSAGGQGGACGMTQTVWVSQEYEDIVTGAVVYTNRFMTQTLQGQAFIRDTQGVIYAISSTGIVGAPTGNIC